MHNTDTGKNNKSAVAIMAVPAVIGAYFYQPTIAALGLDDRATLAGCAIAALLAFAILLDTVKRPILLGLGIVACFIIPWYISLKAMEDYGISDRANDRRCLAIQRDMLSARPRRADNPDLFQALGCRPQGEGSVYAPPRSSEGKSR
jgi:hypothetical protein